MKDLRRVLPGNTKPYERFWQVQNAAESESGEGEIWFYGNISEYSWFEDDITPAMFKEDLKAFGGAPITVRIHSAGGEVFAASAIRSMLMAYEGKVTARIEGLCASAATFVAMAADRVLMQDSAFFMIHDPWTLVVGGAKEMRQAAKMLTTLKKGIIETYQARTTLDENELSRMMDAETWMSAQDAVKYGFVDEVISDGLSAQFETLLRGAQPAVLNALRGFEHVPEAVRLAMGEDAHGEDAGARVGSRGEDAGDTGVVHGQETMNERNETTNEQEAHGGTPEREDFDGEGATVRGQETTNEQIVDERVKAVNALRAKLEKIKEKANEI